MDERTAAKQSPEEQIGHWKAVAEYEKDRADGQDKYIRERIFTLLYHGRTIMDGEQEQVSDIIEKADQAVKYILNGKQGTPLVPASDIAAFIMEFKDRAAVKLAEGALSKAQAAVVIEVLMSFATRFHPETLAWITANNDPQKAD